MWQGFRSLSVFALTLAAVHASLDLDHERHPRARESRYLPEGPLNMGYAANCDHDKILHSVREGLNVLFWFPTSIVTDPITGNPTVSASLDLDCVANVSSTLRSLDLPTTHMVTIGGWNAPHPQDSHSPSSVYSAWKQWNEQVVARPGLEGGFDGIDWDLEGYDDVEHPNNHFTVKCLQTMGEVSQMAKRDGYFVSLVPAESYFDPSTSAFDRSLLHAYPEWQPEFKYHGHNTYTLLVSKYGATTIRPGVSVQTFDFVSIQLYETWSHAAYNITAAPPTHRQTAAQYLVRWAKQVYGGWQVDFSADPEVEWPSQVVSLSPSQLVVGIANAWAGADPKWLLIQPEEAGAAYKQLAEEGLAPRGFVFFDISNEGRLNPRTKKPLFMAQGLNEFLHTRPATLSPSLVDEL